MRVPDTRYQIPDTTRRGFSLLEIVVAMVILSILGSGIFAAITYSKRMSMRANEKAIALSLLEKKINELKQLGAGHIPQQPDPAGEDVSSQLLDGKIFVYVNKPYENSEQFKEIKVTLEWTDRTDPERSLTRRESIVTALFQA